MLIIMPWHPYFIQRPGQYDLNFYMFRRGVTPDNTAPPPCALLYRTLEGTPPLPSTSHSEGWLLYKTRLTRISTPP